MKNKNLAYMLPDELSEYLNTGTPIAIVGCGSVEQHGPHQLLGTDTYFTQIFMDYIAEECGGVVVPMMPFSFIGGLRQWAGTIDILSNNQGAYLEAMSVALLEMGFKGIAMINGHGGGREITFSAARRVFKRTGVPIFAIYSSNYWFTYPEAKETWLAHGVTEISAYEPSIAGAGMVHMGRPEAAENLLANAKEAIERGGDYGETVQPPVYAKARGLGNVSHFYWEERRHSRPSRQISPKAGDAVARVVGRTLGAQITQYAKYLEAQAGK